MPDRTVFLVEKDTASLGFALGMAVIGGNSATVSLLPTSDEEFEKSFKVFIHEIGHTIGGGHEAGAESTRNEPDARAYRCNGGTIMQSVNSAITQLVFSSPNVMIDGQYCGVAGEADNVRAMNAYIEAGRTFEQGYVRTGEVSFASTSFFANEADGVATVALERSGDVSGSAVVMLQVFDDSASYPADYPAWQYRVEFEEGQTTANVDVTLIADAFDEGNETATLKLAYPSRVNVSADTATLTIIDGIAGNAGELEVDVASTVVEGDDIIITLNRVNGSDGELVADVQAFAKTWEDANFAKYVYDYNRYDENVVFADGETSKTIRVATIDDDVPEYTETLSVLVTSAVNVANADTTVSMLDNENGGAYGMFSLSLVTTGEISDTDGSVELKVSRTGGDAAVTVDLEIVLGNSNAFTLAELDQTSLAFEDGEVEKTVTVKLNDYTGTAVSSINLSIRMTSSTDGIIETGQQDVTFAVKTLQATSTPQQPSTGGESGGGSMAWILMFMAPLLYIRRKYSV